MRIHWCVMSQQESAAGLRGLGLLPAYVLWRARSNGFDGWLDFLWRGSLPKHLLGKFGRYERPPMHAPMRAPGGS
jgi:hypothetical protein